jgi:hypothetical protein
VRLENGDRAAIVSGPTRLALHSFGGALTLEAGQYAERFGARVECPVLSLRARSGTELGYLLARGGLGQGIDAVGASLHARRLARPGARRSPAERA